ncbi:conjugative transposon protein TraM [Myroides odoratimimus]|uniref:Conjugative transposon TraM protein n=1 Tax=Myroides odoratimimus CCUG 10230 TaxID=883150 RepID=A0ABP2NF08_9FLAO|nr:conjugative transposon protein TraM [Myroides odoratimimus]EHO11868.1 conjugative transposon TraM protein [Myroides odoratimimus CCUG 10230]MCS7474608.1 conjugative transposon protein TraM [Myroides odoratimimus]MDM1467801.1 conjugative transposon protein TraM [Myroides odoratimimus]MDM1471047.1 conjugative transposon protein TraM [Myroides odoratimimus]MDM1481107.1 conjugative transposon protein TraM [Myroides odoratimimus]
MNHNQSDKTHQIEKVPKENKALQGIIEKHKKHIVFVLMGIVFLGAMYLLFKPEDKEFITHNDSVPEAITQGMPTDKVKAYEKELWEQKQQKNENQMQSLADYWNESQEESNSSYNHQDYNEEPTYTPYEKSYQNYKQSQEVLSSFYESTTNPETERLKKQIEELEARLEEKDTPTPITMDNQLELMEKSFQMAAKYLPGGQNQTELSPSNETTNVKTISSKKQAITVVDKTSKEIVSSLVKPTSLQDFLPINLENNPTFYTAEGERKTQTHKNSIRVSIKEDQVIINEGYIKLKLLESIVINGALLPETSTLIAKVKVSNGRLELSVNSIKIDNSIIETELIGYDNYGQKGLEVLDLQEISASKEIIANMGQTAGTSISMSRSASDQIAGDLTKGLIQGVSGYFSKKVKAQRVTLKQGQELFLVPKE